MSEKYDCLRLDHQICFPLYAAARKVTARYTPLFKELGITYTQYIVLLALWEHDKVPVGELCSRLMLDNGTLSPLLKKMQQAGLVRKDRDRDDDRVVVISLTEEGRALQEQAKDVPAEVAGCIKLPPEKAFALRALLDELLSNKPEKAKNTKGAQV